MTELYKKRKTIAIRDKELWLELDNMKKQNDDYKNLEQVLKYLFDYYKSSTTNK